MNILVGIIIVVVFPFLLFSAYDMIIEEIKIRRAYKEYRKVLLNKQAEKAGGKKERYNSYKI